jgi:7-keto-8-aminopelargonate synthetase-like enzyme
VSLIASVLGPQDAVFADRYCHASIVDGIRLSGSRLFRFAHNDAQHLERLLTQHRHLYKQALIVSESVFSMDGDRAPLADLIALKKRFQTLLMIDEAHALGVFGEKGEGLIGLDLAPDVDWIVGTLGKALGSVGGFVATSPEWKDFWINHARGLIYSTALPPASAAASLAALEVIQEGLLHTQLWQNVGVFRQYTLQFPRKILGDTHIIPIIFDSADKTRACAAFLAQRGLDVPAILSPTVPPNQTRIRINICTFHTVEDIKKLCEALWEV